MRVGGGCSGVLLTPHIVATAAHCYSNMVRECVDYRTDQPDVTGSMEGTRVVVPKPGITLLPMGNPATPDVDIYNVAAALSAPDYNRSDVDDCCGGNPAGCLACAPLGPPAGWEPANKIFDIALVYLKEPITDITPEKILLNIGGPGREGTYNISPSALEDSDVIIAGTSFTENFTRHRAFAVAQISETDYPAGAGDLSPTAYYDTESNCSFVAFTPNTTYSCPECSLFFGPESTGCSVQGDSGGPTFLNATADGGDPVTGIPSGTRVVSGLSSAGSQPSFPRQGASCDPVDWFRYTSTWDHPMTLNGQATYALKGTFIRTRMNDFDLDGIANEVDNCPTVENEDQNNCNERAEEDRGFEKRGDACDPVPCPDLELEKPTQTVVLGGGSSFWGFKAGMSIRDELKVLPQGPNFYFNGSSEGKDFGEQQLNNIQTRFRFCQNDSLKFVDCEEIFIDSTKAGNANLNLSPSNPTLRITMEPVAGGTSFFSKQYTYGNGTEDLVRWKYAQDANAWIAAGYITDYTTIDATFGFDSGLDGWLWTNANTIVGTYNSGNPGARGYAVKLDGTTSTLDIHMPNHAQPLEPEETYLVDWVSPLGEVPYIELFQYPPDLFWPAWDGQWGQRSVLIPAESNKVGLITGDGEPMEYNANIGASLLAMMTSTTDYVFASGVEASIHQSTTSAFDAPIAVIFEEDGTGLADGIWQSGLEIGNSVDMSSALASVSGGPTSRADFVGVYSRSDDLAFVVGGQSGGTPRGDIWMRGVTHNLAWAQIPLQSFSVGDVRSATWSHQDQRLWLLDEIPGEVRLTRVHPDTGWVEIIERWPTVTGAYDTWWLDVDVKGHVYLFASNATEDVHAFVRFDYEPMSTRKPVAVDFIGYGSGALVAGPVFDTRGVARYTDGSSTAYGVDRSPLTGSGGSLASLSSIL